MYTYMYTYINLISISLHLWSDSHTYIHVPLDEVYFGPYPSTYPNLFSSPLAGELAVMAAQG